MAVQPPSRTPRAVRPDGDPDALRAAYLELLKLCLCDLAGTATTSVWAHTDGTMLSRELSGEELGVRAAGVDWPLHGVTMVGLTRLDDLHACVDSVLRDGVEGDVIEAGTWRGGASVLMRAALDSAGARDRTVWVADSFQGFPADDEDHPDRGGFAGVDYLAVGVDRVRENFERLGFDEGVRFVEGFFEDTLPGLTGRTWSIIRLDGDSYEATWTGLQSLYGGLSVGGYVVIDDYNALEECRQAVEEFRTLNGITDPIETVDWTAVRWQRTSAAPLVDEGVPGAAAPVADGRAPAQSVERSEPERIISLHERFLLDERDQLKDELAAYRDQAAALEREVAALKGSPLRGPRAWLGEQRRRRR